MTTEPNPAYFRAILGPIEEPNVSVTLLDDGSMTLFSQGSSITLTLVQRRQLEKISNTF